MRTKTNLFLTYFIIFIFLPTILISQQDQPSKFDNSSIKGQPGFFRVAKTNSGQWWFLTPDNKQFFFEGICAVNRAGTPGGRRAQPGPYSAVIDKKYDYQKSPDNFVEASIEKLHSAGFNALGAWSTEEFFNKQVPFTEIIEFFKEPPFLPSVTGGQGLPDIFDPAWIINVDIKTRALCSPLRNSKDLVGYFTDNEIGFGKTDDFGLDPGFKAGQFDFALLRLVLGMDSDRFSYKYAWDFLLNRHNKSFEKLSEAWGIQINSREDIRRLNNQKTIIPGMAYSSDAQAFVKLYTESYFEIANRSIKRYDPNHLILGCRFGGPPPTYVLDAIKQWTDVISANNYQPILYERYDTVYQYTGLPILIGEFSWNTDLYKLVPYPDEPTEAIQIKERMFRRGKTTLERAAIHDGIIGYTWYRWVQGKSTENEFHDGIVDYNDDIDMHVSELQKINSGLSVLREKSKTNNWKTSTLKNGEMTLFFNELRPGWNHYVRFKIIDGKPSETFYGWKMKGRILKFSNKKDVVTMSVEIVFEDAKSLNKAYIGGKGVYDLKLARSAEKFYGNFKGTYNEKPLSGELKAFYFPEL